MSLIAKFAQSNSGERSIVTSHHGQMIRILQQEPKMLLQQRSGGCSDSRDDLYWQACGLLLFFFLLQIQFRLTLICIGVGFLFKKNMQLSLIITCNLHTAVSDVCTINKFQTSRMKNPSKIWFLDVLLFKENPKNLHENITVSFTFAPEGNANRV